MRAYLVSITTTAAPVVPTQAEITASPSARTWVGDANVPASFHLYNPGPDTVYLGGANVDTTNGFPLLSGASVEIDLIADSIYAIKAGAAQNVNILRTI